MEIKKKLGKLEPFETLQLCCVRQVLTSLRIVSCQLNLQPPYHYRVRKEKFKTLASDKVQ